MALDENIGEEEKGEEEWIPTREEKERSVVYLYGKGKSYREIAKVVHVSFSDISRIIREKYGYPEPKKDDSQLRNETRALKLFEENKEDILEVDSVMFRYRESERVGTVSLEADYEAQAKLEALQKVDKALSKICFAYITEALIKKDGLYMVDVTNSPNKERVESRFIIRWGYLREGSEEALSKMASITDNEKDTLDLAFAYYRLGHYNNPLRIESFFSCLTVLIRDLSNSAYVSTSILKEETKSILRKRNSHFDENKFNKEWEECYPDERCSIAHGHGSKLVDVSKSNEYERMVSTVGYWTREVIYYFINTYQVT